MTCECTNLGSVRSSCTRKSVGIKLRNTTVDMLTSEWNGKKTFCFLVKPEKTIMLTHQFHTISTNEPRLCERLSSCEWSFHLNLGETTEELGHVQPGSSEKHWVQLT